MVVVEEATDVETVAKGVSVEAEADKAATAVEDTILAEVGIRLVAEERDTTAEVVKGESVCN